MKRWASEDIIASSFLFTVEEKRRRERKNRPSIAGSEVGNLNTSPRQDSTLSAATDRDDSRIRRRYLEGETKKTIMGAYGDGLAFRCLQKLNVSEVFKI
jgi:hypothetical protein